MGQWKQDVTPLLTHWSYVFLHKKRRDNHKQGCQTIRYVSYRNDSPAATGLRLPKNIMRCHIVCNQSYCAKLNKNWDVLSDARLLRNGNAILLRRKHHKYDEKKRQQIIARFVRYEALRPDISDLHSSEKPI